MYFVALNIGNTEVERLNACPTILRKPDDTWFSLRQVLWGKLQLAPGFSPAWLCANPEKSAVIRTFVVDSKRRAELVSGAGALTPPPSVEN